MSSPMSVRLAGFLLSCAAWLIAGLLGWLGYAALAQTASPLIPGDNNSTRIGVTSSSGNVAAAVATATLPAAPGMTTYICGFAITSSGSTGAAVVSPTVVGIISGTMTFAYATVAGVTLANPSLIIPFNPPCEPASAQNTAIVVSMPSLGTGNTNATVNAWGYQLRQ